MPPAAVLIASSDLLPALEQRAAAGGPALRFSDAQPLEALEAITLHRPSLVVLERFFAATPRGAALINRIKADPGCANAEIRVLSHTGDYTRVIYKPEAPAGTGISGPALVVPPVPRVPAVPEAPPAQPVARSDRSEPAEPQVHLDWRGTRRHPRFRMRDGVVAQVDGKDAVVVDLSAGGAQVVSGATLRPNQKLRVSLPLEPDARLRATVAWASFELPKGPSATPRYRAGIEFNDEDPRIGPFAERNHKP